MSDGISAPFIRYPIGTSLMMAGILFVGLVAYPLLPVAPLPQVDFPTIQVAASLPGGSPETMASSVAQPLERQLAQIPGIAQMTSTSYLGTAAVTIQFDLNRSIDGAANDVQAAINAAANLLPRQVSEAVDASSGGVPSAGPLEQEKPSTWPPKASKKKDCFHTVAMSVARALGQLTLPAREATSLGSYHLRCPRSAPCWLATSGQFLKPYSCENGPLRRPPRPVFNRACDRRTMPPVRNPARYARGCGACFDDDAAPTSLIAPWAFSRSSSTAS